MMVYWAEMSLLILKSSMVHQNLFDYYNKNVTIDLSATSPSVEMSWHCNNTKSSYFAKSVTNNNNTLKTGLNVGR